MDATTAITATNTLSAALTIFSTVKTDAGTYPLKLSNTLTITSNGPGGSTTFTPASDADRTVFTITIVDPCASATISDVTLSPSTVSVMDGSTGTATFTVPVNSVMTA